MCHLSNYKYKDMASWKICNGLFKSSECDGKINIVKVYC